MALASPNSRQVRPKLARVRPNFGHPGQERPWRPRDTAGGIFSSWSLQAPSVTDFDVAWRDGKLKCSKVPDARVESVAFAKEKPARPRRQTQRSRLSLPIATAPQSEEAASRHGPPPLSECSDTTGRCGVRRRILPKRLRSPSTHDYQRTRARPCPSCTHTSTRRRSNPRACASEASGSEGCSARQRRNQGSDVDAALFVVVKMFALELISRVASGSHRARPTRLATPRTNTSTAR